MFSLEIDSQGCWRISDSLQLASANTQPKFIAVMHGDDGGGGCYIFARGCVTMWVLDIAAVMQ